MILLILLLIPVGGILFILNISTAKTTQIANSVENPFTVEPHSSSLSSVSISANKHLITQIKFTALSASIINLFVSLIIFIVFDFSTNQFQFVQEHHELSHYQIYLGVDGLSIYFVLLTTVITPIALLSN